MNDSNKGEQSPNNQASYSEKTTRLLALSQFIKSVTPVIWIVVILIVVIKIWGSFSLHDIAEKSRLRSKQATTPIVKVEVPPAIDPQINSDVIVALQKARASAEESATKKLDEWLDELSERVNNDFLNWYFDYFTQLYLGAKGIAIDVSTLITRQFNPNGLTANEQKAESITEEFQREFTKRVLKPGIAQLKLERFTRETINDYVFELSEQLSGIQSQYDIPQASWEQYLSGVSTTILDSGGNNQDLSLRALSRGTGYLVAVPLAKATGKLGSGLAAKFLGKASAKATAKITAKISTKTAGKVAGEFSGSTLSVLGLELIDPLAALGILAWDIWDNYHTAQVERPKMQAAILDYLNEMKLALLYNPQDSIMSAIYDFEKGVIKKLTVT